MVLNGTVIAVEPDFQWDGAKLRQLRHARRLTLAELARQLGISDAHLRHIETGHRRPSLTLIGKLEDFLGVTAEELGAAGLPPRHTRTEEPPS